MMVLILDGVLIVYCTFLVLLIVGWKKTKKSSNTFNQSDRKYSILVPFRNEENNLPALIKSLHQIDFNTHSFEVIFINDHSTDQSCDIVKQSKTIKLLQLDNDSGKKAALAYGIKKASGEIIVTTDADCIVPSNWLKIYDQCFENENIKMAFGGVTFHQPKSFFEKVQTVEFASLIGSGTSTLQYGVPSMCNGANLAFSKETYLSVGGYSENQQIASGDDEFLMHKIYKQHQGGVAFVKHTDAIVNTNASSTLSLFFQQRKRWASKWKSYVSFKNSLLAILILLFNVAVILAIWSLIAEFNIILFSILLIKVILEAVFIANILNFLNRKLYLMAFVFLQISYPFYVVLFGLTANFGHYHWKERKHKF